MQLLWHKMKLKTITNWFAADGCQVQDWQQSVSTQLLLYRNVPEPWRDEDYLGAVFTTDWMAKLDRIIFLLVFPDIFDIPAYLKMKYSAMMSCLWMLNVHCKGSYFSFSLGSICLWIYFGFPSVTLSKTEKRLKTQCCASPLYCFVFLPANQDI